MSRCEFILLCLQRDYQSVVSWFSSILEILIYNFFKYCFCAIKTLLLFSNISKLFLPQSFCLLWFCFQKSLLSGICRAYIIKVFQSLHKFHCIRVLLTIFSNIILFSLLFSYPALIFFILSITSTPYIFICSFVYHLIILKFKSNEDFFLCFFIVISSVFNIVGTQSIYSESMKFPLTYFWHYCLMYLYLSIFSYLITYYFLLCSGWIS